MILNFLYEKKYLVRNMYSFHLLLLCECWTTLSENIRGTKYVEKCPLVTNLFLLSFLSLYENLDRNAFPECDPY